MTKSELRCGLLKAKADIKELESELSRFKGIAKRSIDALITKGFLDVRTTQGYSDLIVIVMGLDLKKEENPKEEVK